MPITLPVAPLVCKIRLQGISDEVQGAAEAGIGPVLLGLFMGLLVRTVPGGHADFGRGLNLQFGMSAAVYPVFEDHPIKHSIRRVEWFWIESTGTATVITPFPESPGSGNGDWHIAPQLSSSVRWGVTGHLLFEIICVLAPELKSSRRNSPNGRADRGPSKVSILAPLHHAELNAKNGAKDRREQSGL
ncbi:uncharacterized protein N7482_006440 [Penicillium canariense]|uniref:Uncharacterized protein n=1 Tax=Penicillium canariense TaxID=189055 RepID=A0A9W9LJM8_9EURO|nr:uncharacterized protein N7482_006440 [Penicillium canariense]KAJ5159436.1 hypothetical protein N7482_006440 [Penicillium canariense]